MATLSYLHHKLTTDPDSLTEEEIAQVKIIAQIVNEAMAKLKQRPPSRMASRPLSPKLPGVAALSV